MGKHLPKLIFTTVVPAGIVHSWKHWPWLKTRALWHSSAKEFGGRGNELWIRGANFVVLIGKNIQVGLDFASYKLDVGDVVYPVRNILVGIKASDGEFDYENYGKDECWN